jgi:sugar/nucleoside kinase (ribokinase family)
MTVKEVAKLFDYNKSISFNKKEIDVLSVGELLIDMIAAEYSDSFESKTYHKFFGGAPANIAVNVTRLGGNSLIVATVGKDGLGQFLVNQLKKEGVGTGLIEQVDRSTSMVMITKSKSTPVPIFYRDADYHLSYSDKLEEAVAKSGIVHFSCWPISRVPARNTIEKIIGTARKNGCLVCFDPNYHDLIWPKDEDGISYVKSMIGKVDIVKPSEVDAERLFGQDTHENQLAKFIELGAKLVIMTLGSEGALVSNGQETIKFDTLATDIADTTGAGDAFWSGFYTAAVKGYALKDALSMGFAVSAYKLKHVGALVNLPKLEVIKELYKIQV